MLWGVGVSRNAVEHLVSMLSCDAECFTLDASVGRPNRYRSAQQESMRHVVDTDRRKCVIATMSTVALLCRLL
jgi:hypothetical protein